MQKPKLISLLRPKLLKVFDKLSSDDLQLIVDVYAELWIQGPCLSFALEILEARDLINYIDSLESNRRSRINRKKRLKKYL